VTERLSIPSYASRVLSDERAVGRLLLEKVGALSSECFFFFFVRFERAPVCVLAAERRA
jgi:hypothetical protein